MLPLRRCLRDTSKIFLRRVLMRRLIMLYARDTAHDALRCRRICFVAPSSLRLLFSIFF